MPSPARTLADCLLDIATPLEHAGDLDPLLDRIGDARIVMLGEATHGTSEFYTWRTEITRRLVLEKGFSFLAVEGDWPDCYRVNRFVKARPGSGDSAQAVLHDFARWPTWMWANREVADLVHWLRDLNAQRPEPARVGFYGLDVYSLWESMAAVIEYLERMDPEAAAVARRAYTCFEPYQEDVQEYARATALVPTSCEDAAIAILRELRRKAPDYKADGEEGYFVAEQNALITRNAELYYRTMVRGGPASWNLRDTHMMETLDRLLAFHGGGARAIVWAHNTHVGDARFTDMAQADMVNLGQLARESNPADQVALVGFGTWQGTVIAAEEWGAPMRRLTVPPAREGSTEALLHATGMGDLLLTFHPDREACGGLEQRRGHRAIGVVYDPARERWGNYVPTILPRRYDAFLYVDRSQAVDPLHLPVLVDTEPETFPSGM